MHARTTDSVLPFGSAERASKLKPASPTADSYRGAWKVAYADFVTAMMALFIVLWLVNTGKPVREAIAGYFRDPSGAANKWAAST